MGVKDVCKKGYPMIDIVYNNKNFQRYCLWNRKDLSQVDICVFAAFVFARPDVDYPHASFVDIDDNENVVVSRYNGEIDQYTGEYLDPDLVEEYKIPIEKVFEGFKHYIETFLAQEKEGYKLPF